MQPFRLLEPWDSAWLAGSMFVVVVVVTERCGEQDANRIRS
jgi:hypothetical protein